MDQRNEILAKNLITYSLKVQPGEKVLIEHKGHDSAELVRALVRQVYLAKGIPFVETIDTRILREELLGADEDYFTTKLEWDLLRMKNMDCYIGFSSKDNADEWADVPADKLSLQQRLYNRPLHSKERVNNTRWVVLRYPTPSMAQSAHMSTDAFEDFFYNVCNLDYSKMDQAMEPLKQLMEKTDQVRIEGPGTDLSFSIKDIPVIKCSGQMNIPDGEVYTAPVKTSINGTLQYNTPSGYQGFTHENIQLTFKDGKIIKATSNNDERLNQVFDTDDGARYVGEFAIGVNPYVLDPMMDTLFDEKIAGSFHFTPGNAYEDADNTNRSAIHWDLVCIQRPEYGGGKISFDGVLIRENGRFVLPELSCLNPENLK